MSFQDAYVDMKLLRWIQNKHETHVGKHQCLYRVVQRSFSGITNVADLPNESEGRCSSTMTDSGLDV